MRKRLRGLGAKLALPLALAVFAACAAMMLLLGILLVERENYLLRERAETSGRLVGESLSFAMNNGVSDVGPVERSLRSLPGIIEFRVVPLAGLSSRVVAPDSEEEGVFSVGKEVVLRGEVPGKGPYLRVSGPILAEESCAACHDGVSAGQVLAVTSLYLSAADSRAFVAVFTRRAALLTLGLTLVLILLVLVVLRSVAIAPLRRMRDLVADIAEGQGDLTRRVGIASQDEVGEVAGLVDRFVDQTHEIVLGIRGYSATNAGNAEALGKAAERTRESVALATESVRSTRERIASVSGQNAAVASSTRGIVAGVGQLGERIEDQAAAVTQASSSIREISASIDSVARVTNRKLQAASELLEVTKRGAEKVGVVDAEIGDISRAVDVIGEAIKLINGISARTSLLSMNAAIEAAHAGEYGRGFAVVAEEIRELASSSSAGARQITAALKDIIRRIGEALGASTESREALERIRAEVEELFKAFEEIAGSTREISDGGRSILEASEALMELTREIREGAGDMGRELSRIDEAQAEIARLAASSSEAMDDVSARTQAMDEDIGEIASLSHEAGRVGRLILDAVGRFKVRDGEGERAPGARVSASSPSLVAARAAP